MKEWFMSVLFPRICPVCGKVVDEKGKLICEKCISSVEVIEEPRCRKCGKGLKENETVYCHDCKHKTHIYDRGVCVFEYAGPIKQSMYKFKYENKREFGEYYGMEAARIYGNAFAKWDIDGIIPVPMYWKKERKRGYNQAQIFAKAVGRHADICVIDKCLIRRKATVPQKELDEMHRKHNLENAFAIDPEKIKGHKRILLVDDIYTTGSTMDACAKVLKKAGVQKVYFICISAGNL